MYLILGYVTFKLSDARLGSTMIFLLLPLSYALKKIDIYAAIIGKAVYNGSLNLKEAIHICKEGR